MKALPLEKIRERLAAAESRHTAWYNTDADYDATDEAEWTDDLAFVESYELDRKGSRRMRAMAHEIAREDIPNLAEDVRFLLEALADVWEAGRQAGYDAGSRWARTGEDKDTPNPYRTERP